MVSGWGLHFTCWVRAPTCHVGAFSGGRVGPLKLLALKLSLKYSWELDMKSCCCYCSVAKSYPTLRHHGLQHARPPCPSPSPGACSNSCPLSQWCHPPSQSLSSPSPPAFNLSQYQGLFQWVSSSHQVAKVLELQLQYRSFQWIFRVDFPEKEMATHSSTLSRKIPWTEEPGRLQSMGLQRVRHDWMTPLSLSFRVDWFDLLAIQGTLKSLLQHPIIQKYQFLVLSLFYGPTLTFIEDSYSVRKLSEIWINCLKTDKSSCI